MNPMALVACAPALCLAIDPCAWAQERASAAATAPEIARGAIVLKEPDAAPDATYRYRLVEPSAEAIAKADGKVPLIVFLHGSGERGGDNAAQLVHFAGWTASAEFQSKAPSFVLAMQCPSDEMWSAIDLKSLREQGASPSFAKAPTRAMRALMIAIDEVMATKPIDRSRVYLTGLSMGGFGAFDLAARRPELFAAVVPICGGGDPTTAPRLAALPFLIVHGADDPVVPAALSRRMAEAITAANDASWRSERANIVGSNPPKPMPKRRPNPIYREFPGVGHDSWTPAYRFGGDGVLDWMFAQRREPANPKSLPDSGQPPAVPR